MVTDLGVKHSWNITAAMTVKAVAMTVKAVAMTVKAVAMTVKAVAMTVKAAAMLKIVVTVTTRLVVVGWLRNEDGVDQ
jgi:hypothetical protein